jgi:hypothetical protein
MRIRVRHWEPEEDCIDRVFERDASGEWHCVEPADTRISLSETLDLSEAGAAKVEALNGEIDPWEFSEILPKAVFHDSGETRDVETLVPMIDDLDGEISPIVFFEDQPWLPFATNGGVAVWLPVSIGSWSVDLAYARGIGGGSGIEEASMTSGTFSWEMGVFDNDLVCIHTEPDDDQATVYLTPRNGRSNHELITLLIDWIDWEPVALAVAAARDAGGEWEGTADGLDPDLSSTCEVWASVSL